MTDCPYETSSTPQLTGDHFLGVQMIETINENGFLLTRASVKLVCMNTRGLKSQVSECIVRILGEGLFSLLCSAARTVKFVKTCPTRWE